MYNANIDNVCEAIAVSIHWPSSQAHKWVTTWGYLKTNIKSIHGLRPQLQTDYLQTYKQMKRDIEVG